MERSARAAALKQVLSGQATYRGVVGEHEPTDPVTHEPLTREERERARRETREYYRSDLYRSIRRQLAGFPK